MAIFARGLAAPETPRLLPDGSWLCVELAPSRGCVSHVSADGQTIRMIARTGMPNGCLPDRSGLIWVAETHPHPALMTVTRDGHVEVFLDRCGDEPMLLPNDLVFAPNGLLYMTDSGMLMSEWAPGLQLRPDWASAPFDGRVYEINTQTKAIRILDRGFRFTNGIAMGLDGHLYFNEMITGDVFRIPFRDGMPAGKREWFGNVMSADWSGGFRGPDGMGFGADGSLYCTVFGEKNIAVLDPSGSVIRRIETEGTRPTNVAFGANGERRLYVTEQELGQIEVYDVETAGFPLLG
jgi:gluconolactonase